MGARDPAQAPPLPAHRACHRTTAKTPPLGLDPGAAFWVSACRGLLQTPPPSPGATRNSLLRQILGKARLSGAPDMPLLGSCHIPQAQRNQLDPGMQASSPPAPPGDLRPPPSPKPEPAGDSSLAWDAACSQPLYSPIGTARMIPPGPPTSKLCLFLQRDFPESLECRHTVSDKVLGKSLYLSGSLCPHLRSGDNDQDISEGHGDQESGLLLSSL